MTDKLCVCVSCSSVLHEVQFLYLIFQFLEEGSKYQLYTIYTLMTREWCDYSHVMWQPTWLQPEFRKEEVYVNYVNFLNSHNDCSDHWRTFLTNAYLVGYNTLCHWMSVHIPEDLRYVACKDKCALYNNITNKLCITITNFTIIMFPPYQSHWTVKTKCTNFGKITLKFTWYCYCLLLRKYLYALSESCWSCKCVLSRRVWCGLKRDFLLDVR